MPPPPARDAHLPLPVAAVAFAPRGTAKRLRSLVTRLRREMGSASLASDSLPKTDTTESTSNASWAPSRGVAPPRAADDDDDDGPVSAVVVDNARHPSRWILDAKPGEGLPDVRSEAAGTETVGRRESDARGASDRSSLRDFAASGAWAPVRIVGKFVRCSCWPIVLDFFATKYPDADTERNFQKELWYTQKATHVTGSVFVLFTYLLQIGLQSGTVNQWNRVANWVIGPVISTPLILMALFNWPRTHQRIFQGLVWICIWIGSCGFLVDLHMCNYYKFGGGGDLCHGRDWLGSFFYATALPIAALFALGQKRILHLAGVVVWVIVAFTLVVPAQAAFLRDMLPWVVFQLFVLFFHYMRETSDRRTFTLRMELKVQFKAKQKAQINERKTQDSKRRFTNYIFHEVRVPLNTALLAVQNLKAANVFDKNSEQSVEYAALESSLSMMSTVLNDVLDFSRMEKGGFSSVSRPFSFHRMVQSILGPLRLDATARGLDLTAALDPRIDEVAVGAMRPPGSVLAFEEGDGILLGDEIRIRQVINNLASNACKFTNSGGKVVLTTKLVYPTTESSPLLSHSTRKTSLFDSEDSDPEKVTQVDEAASGCVVVRVEVADTGAGIKSSDLKDGALFSAYHQNQQTLLLGGKGTGLGLSLVRQIVSLSGGRLGVESQSGKGSTFWFEIALPTISPELKLAGVNLARDPSTILSALATPTSYSDSRSEYGFFTPPTRPSDAVAAPERKETIRGGQDSIEMDTIPSPPRAFTLALPNPKIAALAGPLSSLPGLPSSAKSARPVLQFAGRPPRVLVVDDDALTRKLMGRMISRITGSDVQTAENGAIALDMILAPTPESSLLGDNFDIIFLDNQMPVCTGLQVVARLKQLARDDLVVGVTANAELRDQQEYMDAGATVVLTKPVKEVDLRRLLIDADRKRGSRAPSSQAT